MRMVESEEVHRLFYPVIPVIVTARFRGKIGGMPAIWSMPLSFSPPLIGTSVAREHETYRLANSAKRFALNFVDFHHTQKLAYLGDVSGRFVNDKLGAVGFAIRNGEDPGIPVLRDAVAVIECRLVRKIGTGTHDLFISRATHAYAISDFKNYWQLRRYRPIFYNGTEDGKNKSYVFMTLDGELRKVKSLVASQEPKGRMREEFTRRILEVLKHRISDRPQSRSAAIDSI